MQTNRATVVILSLFYKLLSSSYSYLGQTLTNDRIRFHDRTNAFAYALQGNTENLPTVLQFLYNNFEKIREE